MLLYRAGSYLEAASTWETDLASVTVASDRQRLQLWQGKALLQAGQTDAAASVFADLTTANEDDYFGIRAVGLSEGLHQGPQATQETGLDLTPDWDWAAAEQWLTAWTGLPATNRAWETDPHWQRAQELWRIGRASYGDLEVYGLLETYSDDAAALYTLSRELLDAGRVSMSARTGQRLLRVLEADPSDGLPKALMSLSYPAAFGPLVQRYADAESISPLLLLAFVRQESFFYPRAQSGAGALGLTQLLPESAQTAAKELGISSEIPKERLLHADLQPQTGRALHGRPAGSLRRRHFRGAGGVQRRPNLGVALGRSGGGRRRCVSGDCGVQRNAALHRDRLGKLRALSLHLRQRAGTKPASIASRDRTYWKRGSIMLIKTKWLRIALAGAGLAAAATFMVGCGGDDDAGPTSGSGGGTAVAAATDTPTPPSEAPTGESGGAVSGGSGTAIPPAAPGFPNTDGPPDTTASANGESVEMGIGTFCWTRMCVDKIGVPTQGTLTVNNGDIVSVAIPAGVVLKEAVSNAFAAENAMVLDDGSEIWPYPGSPGAEVTSEVAGDAIEVTIDLAPGQYVLAVSMYFESGDSVYGVLLEVQ